MLADLAKIALQQSEMQLFQYIGSGTSFFSTGGSVGHFAEGGSISGAGTATSDSIPAMLSNGEYVVNASAANQHRGLLESINSGSMAHFASGGAVGSVSGGGGGTVNNNTSLNMNLQGGGLTEDDARALQPQIQALIDKRMNQRMSGQGGFAYRMKYGQI